MEIKEYIESGILEAYVIGSASEQEVQDVLRYKEQYPEINIALNEIEADMELVAQNMAVPPPPTLWAKIENEIDGLVIVPDLKPAPKVEEEYRSTRNNDQQFIEVEGSSSHMRIHKAWRWVFAAVFILAKIFLGLAMYYYFENRQAKEQIQELKMELHNTSRHYER
ncbi:MAG: hypothetical protein EOP47_01320 [Sphingobacteriaceae bacterium]|nr:MAG: hypothetical protein EOP47_01320 [Sphingobacteriaceae bacterium]